MYKCTLCNSEFIHMINQKQHESICQFNKTYKEYMSNLKNHQPQTSLKEAIAINNQNINVLVKLVAHQSKVIQNLSKNIAKSDDVIHKLTDFVNKYNKSSDIVNWLNSGINPMMTFNEYLSYKLDTLSYNTMNRLVNMSIYTVVVEILEYCFPKQSSDVLASDNPIFIPKYNNTHIYIYSTVKNIKKWLPLTKITISTVLKFIHKKLIELSIEWSIKNINIIPQHKLNNQIITIETKINSFKFTNYRLTNSIQNVIRKHYSTDHDY